MRQRFYWTASAGGARWPDDVGGLNLPPFNWVKIENRGANDVAVGLANPVITDDNSYIEKVKSGKARIFNVAGPENVPESDTWAQELHLQCAAAGVTTVMIEVSDHPIVDMLWTI